MCGWLLVLDTCKLFSHVLAVRVWNNANIHPSRYALAADIQTIPGLPTAPGYLNVDVDLETGEIDGLF